MIQNDDGVDYGLTSNEVERGLLTSKPAVIQNDDGADSGLTSNEIERGLLTSKPKTHGVAILAAFGAAVGAVIFGYSLGRETRC